MASDIVAQLANLWLTYNCPIREPVPELAGSGGGAAAGVAVVEGGRQSFGVRWPSRIADTVEQHPHRCVADLADRLGDGGEARMEEPRPLEVVEDHQPEVVRHAD